MTPQSPGLRAAKKQRTRQAISDHATRLFIARGFEPTTLAEVAAAAGVATKTVTNYFARKEDLVFDIHEEFVAWPAATVAARASGESALAALRREYRAAIRRFDAQAGFADAEFCRLVDESPTLTARLRELHELREDALTAVLPGTGITRRAAGAHLGTAHRLLFGRAQELTLAGRRRDRVAALLTAEATEVFDLLEPALGGCAIARP